METAEKVESMLINLSGFAFVQCFIPSSPCHGGNTTIFTYIFISQKTHTTLVGDDHVVMQWIFIYFEPFFFLHLSAELDSISSE